MPYVGEIRMFAGSIDPAGWEYCDGRLLTINPETEALFILIGTTYGGDGESTFAMPDLRSRVPIHQGNGPDSLTYPLAQMAGTEAETLTVQQIPGHAHPLQASNAAATLSPTNSVLTVPNSSQAGIRIYNNNAELAPNQTLHAQSVGPAGGSQPHENTQPFLCINYIISVHGDFPSPT